MRSKDIFEDAFPQDTQVGGSHYKKFKTAQEKIKDLIYNQFLIHKY